MGPTKRNYIIKYSKVKALPSQLSSKFADDVRYSVNGNKVVSKYSIPSEKGEARDFRTVKSMINNSVSMGTFRMLDGDFYSHSAQYALRLRNSIED